LRDLGPITEGLEGEIREIAEGNGREFERELMRGKVEFNYHSKHTIL